MDDPVIAALQRALEAAPDDVELRLHLAELLLGSGRADEAVTQVGSVLGAQPSHPRARELMARALAPADAPAPVVPAAPEPTGFDWTAAESQVGDIAEPMFVADDPEAGDVRPDQAAWDVEPAGVTLADVGGMQEVKERLEVAFLAPLRNPELRKMFGKSLRGGLLLYGPPGCGKTFVARAVAGEMGAKFLSVGLADILDMWVGTSEKNVHELFQLARAQAPVVLFLDEIDALGQKRSQTRQSATRGTVNQLLSELDGVDGSNEGVFVLAATNQPWDVDPALRRPGRFDRTLLVLPPDGPAREAILRTHLRHRPVEGIDLHKLAKRTDGFSGADLAHLCEAASEKALVDSMRSGTVRMIGMRDLEAALGEVRPSTNGWFDLARNVVMFGDGDGTYADLRAYMKKTRRL
jgi:AAA+ superfamily predicted ATPase